MRAVVSRPKGEFHAEKRRLIEGTQELCEIFHKVGGLQLQRECLPDQLDCPPYAPTEGNSTIWNQCFSSVCSVSTMAPKVTGFTM